MTYFFYLHTLWHYSMLEKRNTLSFTKECTQTRIHFCLNMHLSFCAFLAISVWLILTGSDWLLCAFLMGFCYKWSLQYCDVLNSIHGHVWMIDFPHYAFFERNIAQCNIYLTIISSSDIVFGQLELIHCFILAWKEAFSVILFVLLTCFYCFCLFFIILS